MPARMSLVVIALLVSGSCRSAIRYCSWSPDEWNAEREWVSSSVPCVLEGVPIAPTDARVLSAFANRYPQCRDARWRRVIPVPVVGGFAPVIRDFAFPGDGYVTLWQSISGAMERTEPERGCVIMIDLREREGAFLASVGGIHYSGCVHRDAVGEQELFTIRVRRQNG